jgi:hypothetical protein
MYGIEKPIVKNIKPSAKPSTAEGVRKNIEWLKKHHREYQGQWVALNEGGLLGSNENLVELRRALKNSGDLSSAIFMSLKIDM